MTNSMRDENSSSICSIQQAADVPPMGPTLHSTAAAYRAGQQKTKLLLIVVTTLLLFNQVHTAAAAAEDDYSKLLNLSYLFYEAQMSGSLPAWNRLLASKPGGYKRNAHLTDGAAIGKDLSGGFYDAGDYLKCPLPLGWTLSNLVLSCLEFKSSYESSGQWDTAVKVIQWGTDWMIKAHVNASDVPAENVFVGQVSDKTDLLYFGRPEHATNRRPVYLVDASTGGADVAAEYAAAFAAAAVLFRSINQTVYAEKLFTHARQAFGFAEAYKTNYKIPGNVFQAYTTFTTDGYAAHLAWASTWMCKYTTTFMKSTKDSYCQAALQWFDTAIRGGLYYNLGYDWDNVLPGAAAVLVGMNLQPVAQGAKAYLERFFLDKWEDTSSLCPKPSYSTVCYTPKGLAYYGDWGTLRNTANAMFIAALMAKHGIRKQQHVCWTRMQMRYITGSLVGTRRSYIIGYGPKQPQQPFHRRSACSADYTGPCTEHIGGTCCLGEKGVGAGGCCDAANFASQQPALVQLTGALVAGPDQSDSFPDIRVDYQRSQVALDYNAGLTGAAAALAYFASTGMLAPCGAGPGILTPIISNGTKTTPLTGSHNSTLALTRNLNNDTTPAAPNSQDSKGLPAGPLLVGYYMTEADQGIGVTAAGNADLANIPGHLNVIILGFAKPNCTYMKDSFNSTGSGLGFKTPGPMVQTAIATLKQQHPATRVLLGVGGPTYTNFESVNTRCIGALLEDFGLDGVDINYQAPSNCKRTNSGIVCNTDKQSIAALAALRSALPGPSYIISLTTRPVGLYGEPPYEKAKPLTSLTGVNLAMAKSKVGQTVDLINVMAYDAGNWSTTGFSWQEAYRAAKAYWPGKAITVAVSIGPDRWPPAPLSHQVTIDGAAFRASYVKEYSKKAQYGISLWNLQKQGCPNARQLAAAVCSAYSLGNCKKPLPFAEQTCALPSTMKQQSMAANPKPLAGALAAPHNSSSAVRIPLAPPPSSAYMAQALVGLQPPAPSASEKVIPGDTSQGSSGSLRNQVPHSWDTSPNNMNDSEMVVSASDKLAPTGMVNSNQTTSGPSSTTNSTPGTASQGLSAALQYQIPNSSNNSANTLNRSGPAGLAFAGSNLAPTGMLNGTETTNSSNSGMLPSELMTEHNNAELLPLSRQNGAPTVASLNKFSTPSAVANKPVDNYYSTANSTSTPQHAVAVNKTMDSHSSVTVEVLQQQLLPVQWTATSNASSSLSGVPVANNSSVTLAPVNVSSPQTVATAASAAVNASVAPSATAIAAVDASLSTPAATAAVSVNALSPQTPATAAPVNASAQPLITTAAPAAAVDASTPPSAAPVNASSPAAAAAIATAAPVNASSAPSLATATAIAAPVNASLQPLVTAAATAAPINASLPLPAATATPTAASFNASLQPLTAAATAGSIHASAPTPAATAATTNASPPPTAATAATTNASAPPTAATAATNNASAAPTAATAATTNASAAPTAATAATAAPASASLPPSVAAAAPINASSSPVTTVATAPPNASLPSPAPAAPASADKVATALSSAPSAEATSANTSSSVKSAAAPINASSPPSSPPEATASAATVNASILPVPTPTAPVNAFVPPPVAPATTASVNASGPPPVAPATATADAAAPQTTATPGWSHSNSSDAAAAAAPQQQVAAAAGLLVNGGTTAAANKDLAATAGGSQSDITTAAVTAPTLLQQQAAAASKSDLAAATDESPSISSAAAAVPPPLPRLPQVMTVAAGLAVRRGTTAAAAAANTSAQMIWNSAAANMMLLEPNNKSLTPAHDDRSAATTAASNKSATVDTTAAAATTDSGLAVASNKGPATVKGTAAGATNGSLADTSSSSSVTVNTTAATMANSSLAAASSNSPAAVKTTSPAVASSGLIAANNHPIADVDSNAALAASATLAAPTIGTANSSGILAPVTQDAIRHMPANDGSPASGSNLRVAADSSGKQDHAAAGHDRVDDRIATSDSNLTAAANTTAAAVDGREMQVNNSNSAAAAASNNLTAAGKTTAAAINSRETQANNSSAAAASSSLTAVRLTSSRDRHRASSMAHKSTSPAASSGSATAQPTNTAAADPAAAGNAAGLKHSNDRRSPSSTANSSTSMVASKVSAVAAPTSPAAADTTAAATKAPFNSPINSTAHLSSATRATTTTNNNLSVPITSRLASGAVSTNKVQTSASSTATNSSNTPQPSDPAVIEQIPPGDDFPGHHPKPPAAVQAPFTSLVNTTAHNSSATGAPTSNPSIPITSHPAISAVSAKDLQTGTRYSGNSSSTLQPLEPLPSDPALIEPIRPGDDFPGHRPQPPAATKAPSNSLANTTAHNSSATRAATSSAPSAQATSLPATSAAPAKYVQTTAGRRTANSSTQQPSETLPSDPAVLEPLPPGDKIPGDSSKPPVPSDPPGRCSVEVPAWSACGGISGSCPPALIAAGKCNDAPWEDHCCSASHYCKRENAWFWMCTPGTGATAEYAETYKPSDSKPEPAVHRADLCKVTVSGWQGCGGQGAACPAELALGKKCADAPWEGYCCAAGWKCSRDTRWFWICQQDESSETAQQHMRQVELAALERNNANVPVCSTTVPHWGSCGGSGNQCVASLRAGGKCVDSIWDGHCCADGSVCVRHNKWYYQCKPVITTTAAAVSAAAAPVLSTAGMVDEKFDTLVIKAPQTAKASRQVVVEVALSRQGDPVANADVQVTMTTTTTSKPETTNSAALMVAHLSPTVTLKGSTSSSGIATFQVPRALVRESGFETVVTAISPGSRARGGRGEIIAQSPQATILWV